MADWGLHATAVHFTEEAPGAQKAKVLGPSGSHS